MAEKLSEDTQGKNALLERVGNDPDVLNLIVQAYRKGHSAARDEIDANDAPTTTQKSEPPADPPTPELDAQEARDQGYATAQQIVQMCTLAGQADQAPGFLQKGYTIEQARGMLEEIKAHMAERDEILSMIAPQTQSADEASQYVVTKLDIKGIYAQRNKRLVGIES